MNEVAIKEKLIDVATQKYGSIFPVEGHAHLFDCFTKERGSILFWFNDPDNSTKMLIFDIENNEVVGM